MSLPALYETLTLMQNESETEFHRVCKVSPTQQLTKLTLLLRESGDFQLKHPLAGSESPNMSSTLRFWFLFHGGRQLYCPPVVTSLRLGVLNQV